MDSELQVTHACNFIGRKMTGLQSCLACHPNLQGEFQAIKRSCLNIKGKWYLKSNS